MAMMSAQQEVIVALRGIGELDLADRLERCMTARRERRGGDGWPYTCRSAACVWCRRPMIRSWWNGMCRWSAEATHRALPSCGSIRRLACPTPSDGCGAGCAMFEIGWRGTGVDGATSLRWNGRRRRHGMVMVSHEGIDRCEVEDVLHRRWPDVVVKELEQEEPAVAMSPGDAADLGRHRRGVEPMRVVIMPQHDRQTITSPVVEPMPVLV